MNYQTSAGPRLTTPCLDCERPAVPFTSLCRGCYRARRPLGCSDCGGPRDGTHGAVCAACSNRRWRAQQKGT